MSTVFKLSHGDMTRRVAFPGLPTWAGLAAKVADIFAIPESHVGLSYIDSEDEEIILNTEEELQDFYVSVHQPGKSIKFIVKNTLAFHPSHGSLPYRPPTPGPQVEGISFPPGLPMVPMHFGPAYLAFALIYGAPPALSEFPPGPYRHRGPRSLSVPPCPPSYAPRYGHGLEPAEQSFYTLTPPFVGRHGPSSHSFWPRAPPFSPHPHPPRLPHEHLVPPSSPSLRNTPLIGELRNHSGAFPGLHHHRDFFGGHNPYGTSPGHFPGSGLNASGHNHTSARGYYHWAQAASPDSHSDNSSPGREHHEHSRNLRCL